MHEIDVREPREHRGQHDAAGIARAVIELAGIRARIGDELLQRARRNARMHHDEERVVAHQRHRCEIGKRIVGRVLAQVRHRGERAVGAKDQRVSVGRRSRHLRRGDRAVRARLVLHDDRLPERLAERLRQDAHHDIGRGPGAEGHEHADRL